MTAPFSAPSSYWQVSRAPRYSLSFALPLPRFYQVPAVLLAHGTRSVRNGADVILQSLFMAVAGSWGPLVFMVCLIGVGGWLVVRDLRKGSRLRVSVFCGMMAEALLLALLFGFLVGGVTSGVLGGLQVLARPAGGDLDRWTRLMLSLGAGITRSCCSACCSWARSPRRRAPCSAGAPSRRAARPPLPAPRFFLGFTIMAPTAAGWRAFPFWFSWGEGWFFSGVTLHAPLGGLLGG